MESPDQAQFCGGVDATRRRRITGMLSIDIGFYEGGALIQEFPNSRGPNLDPK